MRFLALTEDKHLRRDVKFDRQVTCIDCALNRFDTYGVIEKKEGKRFERLYFVCVNCGKLIRGDSTSDILGDSSD